MKLLFIGDIFGRPGRDLVRHGLDAVVAHHHVDFVIANGENAAGGNGLTREIGDQLLSQGVDVITSGNHIWDKKEVYEYLGVEARVLRPANYPDAPGRGSFVARARNGRSVGVLNVMGRVHMANLDDPFRIAEREIAAMSERTRIIFVDFHAEVTSEKIAMGWFLDGKVKLPGGTAYLTDVGMTGPHDGIIGVEKAAVLQRFLTGLPARFESASGDPRMHAVVITAIDETGRATRIERLSYSLDDLDLLSSTVSDEEAAAERR